jgi:Gas vesicle synthesis protein GvpL/GvpF
MADGDGVWAYAVTSHVEEGALRGLTGVNGEPIYALTAAGLTAAVGAVPLAGFGDQALRRNLENLAWLETVARRHHEVIESVAQGTPVVPMRLATVYHSDEGISAMLSSRRDDLAAALARVSGRDEWGVKVYTSPRQAPAPGAASGTASASPGAAYLHRRKSELSAGEEERRSAAASAEEIHAVLSGLAAASLLRPPQAPQLSGHTGQVIVNSAYLVDAEGADRLRETVEDLAGRHNTVHIELTGPWPPYSFAAIEHTEPAYGAAT